MEYLVVESKNIDGLVKKVNEALQNGYKLQGGVNYNADQRWGESYNQALIKETPAGGKRRTRRN